MLELRLITAAETYRLRAEVLRPGQPIELSRFQQDQDPKVFHVGAFTEQSELPVGVGTFAPEENKTLFKSINEQPQNAYRLRGMAVDPNKRKMNIGRLILQFSEQELKARDCDFLWFNAREAAYTFYQKLGYKFQGEGFQIPEIGPHKIMYKHLIELKS